MALTVAVPHNPDAGSMHLLIDAAIIAGAPASKEITLDFRRVGFVESLAIVILSNGREIAAWRSAIAIAAGKGRLSPISMTRDFSKPIGEHPFRRGRGRARPPFRFDACADSHQWIDGNIFPWLESKLNVKQSALTEFKTSVREIFNNIADHSGQDVGCMHVQWHPNISRVKIAVSDFGVGIPAEVRKAVAIANDATAIVAATREGFSSKPGKNMGAGLSYLIDNVVRLNQGWVGIYSGQGYATFSHGKPSAGLLKGLYPGTLINMIFRADRLVVGDEDVDDVQW